MDHYLRKLGDIFQELRFESADEVDAEAYIIEKLTGVEEHTHRSIDFAEQTFGFHWTWTSEIGDSTEKPMQREKELADADSKDNVLRRTSSLLLSYESGD